ncbi:hypothetical protein [Mesorhizobium cantuariense]|uniref:Uncharacterized protein n=1 Tax=Mesorhizobium cantuariense TaxID=1300275 RepID=A0ABV7MUF9_9HYPH
MNLLLTLSTGAPSGVARVERAARAEEGQQQPVGLQCRPAEAGGCGGTRTRHGDAARGGQVDLQLGDAGGVEQAVGGGNGAGECIGLEQLLAQLLDQPVSAAPTLAERCCPGFDLVAKRGDVGPGFTLRGLRAALAGSVDSFFQKGDLVVAVVEDCTRGGQVAIAEDRTVLGLRQLGSAGDRIVEVDVEQGDDGSEFGSRPRPAELLGMGGCHWGVSLWMECGAAAGYLPPRGGDGRQARGGRHDRMRPSATDEDWRFAWSAGILFST